MAIDLPAATDRQEPRYLAAKSVRWPDGRPLCGHDKGHDGDGNHDGYCRNTAGMKTSHFGSGSCKSHGGTSPSHETKAQREMATKAAATYGAPVDIDPISALFAEVHRTAGHVAWLSNVVAHLDPDELIWGVTQETDSQSGEFPGVDVVKSAKPTVWLDLYHRERKHLVDVCSKVVSLSLENRRDTAARAQAAQMFLLLEALLSDSDAALSPVQQVALRRAMLAQVATLEGARMPSKVIDGVSR